MGAVEKTMTSVGETADTVGDAAKSVGRAGGRPARDMVYMGLKGAAIALRGTSIVCGKCADGLDASAAMARGAAGAMSPSVAAALSAGQTAAASLQAAQGAQIDINAASLDELQGIANIDEVRAEEIIRARETEPFESLDQLSRVSGIGAKRIDEIKAEGLAAVG